MKTLLKSLTAIFTLVLGMNANEIKRINPDTIVDSSAWGFAQVVVPPKNGHTVYIAGQFGGDTNGKLTSNTMQGQMKQTFKNLSEAIKAAGAKPEHIVYIRVLIVDHKEEYLSYLSSEVQNLFGKNIPASTLIPVPRLALDGMLFEIEATLVIPQ